MEMLLGQWKDIEVFRSRGSVVQHDLTLLDIEGR